MTRSAPIYITVPAVTMSGPRPLPMGMSTTPRTGRCSGSSHWLVQPPHQTWPMCARCCKHMASARPLARHPFRAELAFCGHHLGVGCRLCMPTAVRDRCRLRREQAGTRGHIYVVRAEARAGLQWCTTAFATPRWRDDSTCRARHLNRWPPFRSQIAEGTMMGNARTSVASSHLFSHGLPGFLSRRR
jgi:hypothetical protein